MAIRSRVGLTLLAFASLVGCASIVRLDGIGPSSETNGDGGSPDDPGDSSTVTADGSITTTDGITITPASLNLAFNCGSHSSADITIANDSDTAQTYEVDVPADANFTLDGGVDGGLSGSVAPHTKAFVTVVATAAAPGDIGADVRVRAGSTETSVAVTGSVNGAALAIAPPTLDFGNIHVGVESQNATATFSNAGNVPVTVTGFGGAGADQFVFPLSITVPANGSTTAAIQMIAGANPGPLSATLAPTLSTPVCGGLPSWTLTGNRVNDAVTVDPATLDFGQLDCLSTPTAKLPVTLSNYDTTPLPYTASLKASSRFNIVSGASGTVVAGDGNQKAGTATITIGLNPPGSFYGDVPEQLTVTPMGKTPVMVNLHQLVTGADMQYQPPVNGNSVSIRDTGRNSVPLKNVGNATVCVNYSSTGSSTISTENDGDVYGPGELGDVGVYFDPSWNDNSTHTGTVSIFLEQCPGRGKNAPFCNGPPQLAVTARQ